MSTKNILTDETEIAINSFKNRLKSLGFKKIIDGCDYTTYRYDELCEDTSKSLTLEIQEKSGATTYNLYTTDFDNTKPKGHQKFIKRVYRTMVSFKYSEKEFDKIIKKYKFSTLKKSK